MGWIIDWLAQAADWINYAVNWLLNQIAAFQAFFVDIWNALVGGMWSFRLADVLPDPGLLSLRDWVSGAGEFIGVFYSVLDHVAIASVASSAIALYITIGIAAMAYRAWLIVKQAAPVIG
jgi:hypothetical protein